MENSKLCKKFLKVFSNQSVPSIEKNIIIIALFNQIIQYVIKDCGETSLIKLNDRVNIRLN
jgi:hypothetical protein